MSPLRLTRCVAAATLAAWGSANAQPAVFPARGATIEISVDSTGKASVSEHWRLAGVPPDLSLQYLETACGAVSPIVFALDGASVGYRTVRNAPWVVLRPAMAVRNGTGAAELRVDYLVQVNGSKLSIPVVMPGAPLESGAGGGAVAVEVSISLPPSWRGARVVFPQLHPTEEPGHWSARLPAIPSLVRVRRDPPVDQAPCAPLHADEGGGSSGPFERIFFAFVATVVLWVPLYMLWVRVGRDAGSPSR